MMSDDFEINLDDLDNLDLSSLFDDITEDELKQLLKHLEAEIAAEIEEDI